MKNNIRFIAYVGILTAMEIVLNRFMSINAWNIKIGFAFVPVAAAGMLMGPLGGAVVGGLGDLLGALMFPTGPYFPGFTLTAALTGAVFGFFLHKNHNWKKTLLAVLINQPVLSLLLNSYWISVLYKSPYVPLLATRAIQCLIIAPVQFFVIEYVIARVLKGRKIML